MTNNTEANFSYPTECLTEWCENEVDETDAESRCPDCWLDRYESFQFRRLNR